MTDEEKNEIQWTPLESNPDAMNKFLWTIGVPKDWSVVDVYGLDEELLEFIGGPVVALILLYPETVHKHVLSIIQDTIDNTMDDDNRQNVFFMKQTIRHVCGTVALIHSVANNCHRIVLQENSSLKNYIDKCRQLSTPEERGRLLEVSKDICSAHHECASDGQSTIPAADDNVSGHFVALVHNNGYLYHLDGSQPKPVKHCQTSDENFLLDAVRLIRQLVAKDPTDLNFSVVALIHQNPDLM
ncbi:ubiquitin carboxyl-terminal hydrolase isozyme L3-like [Oppia nitens]|uniref:ubiquitin carboxyl-terminal hydrolase isozyme L3-like n=1 Tax=Oppia nitens TaxID=1686743 RepID=UPI0023DBDDBB|nr:ubiquitin carboxyl-terminal hydrolase isozyme L3-like [Oppia nitens]